MKKFSVKVFETHKFTCDKCNAQHTVKTDCLIYEDEIEWCINIKEFVFSSYIDKELPAIQLSESLGSAYKELCTNAISYNLTESQLHELKTFIWGLRLTCEEYPLAIVLLQII